MKNLNKIVGGMLVVGFSLSLLSGCGGMMHDKEMKEDGMKKDKMMKENKMMMDKEMDKEMMKK